MYHPLNKRKREFISNLAFRPREPHYVFVVAGCFPYMWRQKFRPSISTDLAVGFQSFLFFKLWVPFQGEGVSAKNRRTNVSRVPSPQQSEAGRRPGCSPKYSQLNQTKNLTNVIPYGIFKYIIGRYTFKTGKLTN